jgi:hypothetical protein
LRALSSRVPKVAPFHQVKILPRMLMKLFSIAVAGHRAAALQQGPFADPP